MTKTHKHLPCLLLCAVFCVIAVVQVEIDTDFTHMVASGHDIVADMSSLWHNYRTVLPNAKNLIQQWSYDLLLYGADYIGGIVGVQFFTIFQFAGLIFMVYRYFIKRLDSLSAVTACLIYLVSFYETLYSCRPWLISVILLLGQCFIVRRYIATNNKTILWWLPVFVLLEANVHLSFVIFHFVFLLPYIVPMIIKKWNIFDNDIISAGQIKRDKLYLIGIVVGMLAAGFCNPYTYRAYTLIFDSRSISLLQITELQSTPFLSIQGVTALVVIGVTIYLAIKRKLSLSTFWLTLGCLILTFLMCRNYLFLPVSVPFLLLDWFKNISLTEKLSPVRLSAVFMRITSIVLCMIILLMPLGVILHTTLKVVPEALDTHKIYPVEAFEYLDTHCDVSQIKLYTEFNQGGYFLYKGVGKIYLMAKTEPLLKNINGVKDLVQEDFVITYSNNIEAIEAFLDEYDFDYLCVTTLSNALAAYLAMSPEYKCVYQKCGEVFNTTVYQVQLFEHIR